MIRHDFTRSSAHEISLLAHVGSFVGYAPTWWSERLHDTHVHTYFHTAVFLFTAKHSICTPVILRKF